MDYKAEFESAVKTVEDLLLEIDELKIRNAVLANRIFEEREERTARQYGYIVGVSDIDEFVYRDVSKAYDRAEYLNADDGLWRTVTRVKIIGG